MSDTIIHPARTNLILAGLPRPEWDRLEHCLDLVALEHGTILNEKAGAAYIYFPTTASVSWLHLMEDGDAPEIAVVGREGLVGKSNHFGVYAPATQFLVQTPGLAYRLDAALLDREMEYSNTLYRLMLIYAQTLFQQMALTIVSSRSQAVEEQLCRRLLLGLDRADCNTMPMTQESLAYMLNVRREGISKAAGHLQQEGLISYRRGHITVIDREGLEERAGECYSSQLSAL
jgi:CRP-like cAMP-binding protein